MRLGRPRPAGAGRSLAWAALAVASLAGCGPRNFANENDRLRAEREELRDRVARLELESGGLRAQLEAAERALELGPGVLGALPSVARVEIGRWSGWEGIGSDGATEGRSGEEGDGWGGGPTRRREDGVCAGATFVVYVRPVDGRGRVAPVVGGIEVIVDVLGDGSSGPARFGRVELDAAGAADAYRSGLMGTYYEAAVGEGEPGEAGGNRQEAGAGSAAVVTVRVTDAVSGAVVETREVVGE